MDDGGADGYDGIRPRGASGPGAGGPGTPAGPAGDRRPPSRPGLEALRLAVHRPEEVADRLDEVLFVDELQRRAFAALTEVGQPAPGVEEAPPDVADLLRRVTVEEPVMLSDPWSIRWTRWWPSWSGRPPAGPWAICRRRPRTSSGDLGAVAAETAAVRRWLEELDDPASGREASDRLLAWLVGGKQEG